MKSRIEKLERALVIAKMIEGMKKRWLNLYFSSMNRNMLPEIRRDTKKHMNTCADAIQRLENAYTNTISEL